jgi:putative endonuclease
MHQTHNVGELGEQLVAEWLQTQNWVILHHRWRCRWGEIDLIAQQEEAGRLGDREIRRAFSPISEQTNNLITPDISCGKPNGERPAILTSRYANTPSSLLAFVEVKTRSRGNWDTDGLLAITPPKQAKLWRTAELFLAEHPELAILPCRFDVALVSCQRLSQRSRRDQMSLYSSAASTKAIQVPPIQLGQPIVAAGYQLILQDYIQSAFG